MRRFITLVMASMLAMVAFLPGQNVAFAEERVCRGTLGAVTVDNLRVPQGRSCTLNRTYVKGTIKVEANATLRAYGVRVIGNVQAENAASVYVLSSSRVGGSIQIVQGGDARVNNSRVNGDILFDSQEGPLRAKGNYVGGNLQAFQNRGGIVISSNRIDGNLQCKENYPRPTGSGNIVQGSKEDQCARL